MTLTLQKKCPQCHQSDTVHIVDAHLKCQAESCDFYIGLTCPLCNTALSQQPFTDEGDRRQTQCGRCHTIIPLKKIQYLIENSLIVDQDSRCKLCNGPTIHRPDANLGHRCFSFPKCSGQADLFGQAQESLIFLDFETTGLEVGRDAIIEIGALKIDEEGYEHTLQELVKPPGPIDPRITQITGITDDMVADAPPLKEVMTRLVNFIGNGKVIAHNAEFDVPWLLTSSIRYGLDLKNNTVICTLKWAKKGKEARASLGILSKKYKIGHENAHRALADAAVTKELYLIFDQQYAGLRVEENLEDYREFCQKLVDKYANYVQA